MAKKGSLCCPEMFCRHKIIGHIRDSIPLLFGKSLSVAEIKPEQIN
jgi:hypothetical protein